MQAWLADLHASASTSRMEPTFRSRMQMQVQEVTGLALSMNPGEIDSWLEQMNDEPRHPPSFRYLSSVLSSEPRKNLITNLSRGMRSRALARPGPTHEKEGRKGRGGGGWGKQPIVTSRQRVWGKGGVLVTRKARSAAGAGKGRRCAGGGQVGRPSIKHCACHSSFHHLPALPSSPRSCHLTYLTLLLVRSRLRWILLSGIKSGDSQCSRANCLSRGGGGEWVVGGRRARRIATIRICGRVVGDKGAAWG